MTPNLDAQIRCIEQELARRRRTFPLLLKDGTLTQHMAAHELLTMEAVLETLQTLRARSRVAARDRQEVPHAQSPD